MTALELTDVVKSYPVRRGILGRRSGAVQAVSDVSVSVPPGTTFGLVGGPDAARAHSDVVPHD